MNWRLLFLFILLLFFSIFPSARSPCPCNPCPYCPRLRCPCFRCLPVFSRKPSNDSKVFFALKYSKQLQVNNVFINTCTLCSTLPGNKYSVFCIHLYSQELIECLPHVSKISIFNQRVRICPYSFIQHKFIPTFTKPGKKVETSHNQLNFHINNLGINP